MDNSTCLPGVGGRALAWGVAAQQRTYGVLGVGTRALAWGMQPNLGSDTMRPFPWTMQVREAYAEDDFQWDQLRNLAVTETKEQNVSMLRETMETTTSMDTLAEHPYWPAPNWLGE
mmetsp:Transcript_3461/g.9980  ORF Transcript_3461/g.9980 Transcript_3461/m.9980 type:complete len:116 (-) Transcript_3461:304-651(-)